MCLNMILNVKWFKLGLVGSLDDIFAIKDGHYNNKSGQFGLISDIAD